MNSSHPNQRSNIRYCVLLGCVLLLGSAVILPLLGSRVPGTRYFSGKVEDVVPESSDFRDWEVVELPIADTPEMKRAVAELLNFEQGIYREFKKSGLRISIYLAYWPPGRMSQRSVGGHTPDVCWVGAGWSNLLSDAKSILYNLPGVGQVSLQIRQFKSDTIIEHVVFGHFVRGRPVSYGDASGPRWHSFITDLVNDGLSQREEQFFIRISSNRPVVEMLSSAPARECLARLGDVLGRSRGGPVK
jgi:hypothetical protein